MKSQPCQRSLQWDQIAYGTIRRQSYRRRNSLRKACWQESLYSSDSLNPTSSADLPFEFVRVQFPLRLAFAITINKSQGQTLNHVGVIIQQPVFAHGQLYVAFSRVTNEANLHLVVPNSDEAQTQGRITNVVYPEVFR